MSNGTGRRAFAAIGMAAAAMGRAAGAQGTDRPIRLLVPGAPSTQPDLVARLLAEEMSRQLGQPVVAEPRPGGNGIVAVNALKQQQPDGAVLMLGGGSVLTYNPALYAWPPYNPLHDFSAVGLVANSPMLLVASRRSGIATVADLLEKARARPEALTFASGGYGHSTHLAMEMLCDVAGIRLTHVPFPTRSPLPELMSGTINLATGPVSSGLPTVLAGELVPVALLAASRLPALPDVPTLAEAGLDCPLVPVWYAVVGPAGMPGDVVARLNAAIGRAIAAPATQARFADLQITPLSGSPEQVGERIRTEAATWVPFIRRLGLTSG
ncbi:tripartite tricarboxylate transporter substrate binding protein [Roseomonas sp. KE2513]|uniref:tripartite tricarboxylate transporter substrate binding protein n=1 Tax=Roseomonas sp. KE2513 TaxID=2479202 RepID=UPI0018DFFFE2|nr:tripartite tricarboxylate transporter substrate binding protein [Roseomonas sp. KE2513]MBI0538609.1 tripartite tricarboxylate transporter substrate binding protein [Roseomonas sp. KE2513]